MLSIGYRFLASGGVDGQFIKGEQSEAFGLGMISVGKMLHVKHSAGNHSIFCRHLQQA